jgi:2-amino-4-hydroxy-6-hydroxymethyldihydropteridine diphosphokinase
MGDKSHVCTRPRKLHKRRLRSELNNHFIVLYSLFRELRGGFDFDGIFQIKTSLSPIELLDRLQSIENHLGRVKLIDKGPRNIDLDILLYDDTTFSNERLQIPHRLMLEREFVLRPLCELVIHFTIHDNTH